MNGTSEWNKFNLKIRDLNTLKSFKQQVFNFIRPRQSSTFKLHNPLGSKLFTRSWSQSFEGKQI